jgi:predicted transcriptional regulator of viral defense system
MKVIVLPDVMYHIERMTSNHESQQDRAIALLRREGMARLSEFAKSGITRATISPMKERGLVLRLGRGLYQLPDASFGTNHALAATAKLVPKGVVCLTSALAYHELTLGEGIAVAVHQILPHAW